MIPITETDITNKELEIVTEPSFTYYIKEVKDNVRLKGNTDDIEAIKQAIYLMLSIERYDYLMYSWNYGVELKDLFGREREYVVPELERRITEALLQDDRITAVTDFRFNIKGSDYAVTFKVATILGATEITKVVSL